ncbi:hypothetical protein, partial [Plasmodium yoelii yoelii]
QFIFFIIIIFICVYWHNILHIIYNICYIRILIRNKKNKIYFKFTQLYNFFWGF